VRKILKYNLENFGFEGADWDGVHFKYLPVDHLSPFLRKTINYGKYLVAQAVGEFLSVAVGRCWTKT